jgi:hypothetical protein
LIGKSQRERLRTSGAETHLVKLRINTDDVLDLMVHLEFERVHLAVKVDAVEEAHREDLRVSLSTVAGTRALGGAADLGNDNVCEE